MKVLLLNHPFAFFLLALALAGLISSSIFMGMVLTAARRFRRQAARVETGYTPPLSLLKPLHGAEPNLEAHLESFYRQDYPVYEVLFCARHAEDAGLAAARRVAARHPHIPSRFFTTGEHTWVNAKVSSLERMAAAAQHDIFIVSDSDVRVAPDYLKAVAAPFADPAVGGMTCLYRGTTEAGLWSQLEAAGMSVEMTAGVLVADMLEGTRFMLGPTMGVRRDAVERMGGFGVLGEYCADDFVLGERVAEQGSRVILSHHVIDHIILNLSLLDSLRHQARWMRSTRFSRPKGHFGTVLTFSLPFALLGWLSALALGLPALAWALLGFGIAARALMAIVLARDVVHEPRVLRTALLYPLRDLMGFFFWLASYASSTILWRGQVFRLTAGGRMEPLGGQAAAVSTGAAKV